MCPLNTDSPYDANFIANDGTCSAIIGNKVGIMTTLDFS